MLSTQETVPAFRRGGVELQSVNAHQVVDHGSEIKQQVHYVRTLHHRPAPNVHSHDRGQRRCSVRSESPLLFGFPISRTQKPSGLTLQSPLQGVPSERSQWPMTTD